MWITGKSGNRTAEQSCEVRNISAQETSEAPRPVASNESFCVFAGLLESAREQYLHLKRVNQQDVQDSETACNGESMSGEKAVVTCQKYQFSENKKIGLF